MSTSETTYYEKQGPAYTAPHSEMHPIQDTIEYMKEYARENPEHAALWIFGAGFLLGWKLKPW